MNFTYFMTVWSALLGPSTAPGDIGLVDRVDENGVVETVLVIEGMDDPFSPDELEILVDGSDLWVRTIGATSGGFRVLESEVDRIEVVLYAGNDIFRAVATAVATIDIPMTVWGGEGNDSLTTGLGDDYVMGDDGSFLTLGDDDIWTGVGNDTVSGGTGWDTIDAGEGDDIVYGFLPVASHSAILFCYQDRDTIDGGPGSDYIEGGPDNDTIHAGVEGESSIIDTVYGFVPAPDDLEIDCADDDVIEAEGSVLLAGGGPGADHVYGWDLDDVLSGGTGDDEISGHQGVDVIQGGEGNDTISCGFGDDTASGGPGSDEIFGASGDDTLQGDDGDDRIQGHSGNDTLSGGDGADMLAGHDGDDTLRGGHGNDSLIGGLGDDYLDGGTGTDYLSGSAGYDRLDGGDGADVLTGDEDSDVLIGGVTDDDVDDLRGAGGDDRLYGGGGDDLLFGDDGDDLLVSVDRADGDFLYGGPGFDSFWFDPGEEPMVPSSAESESNLHVVDKIRNFDDYTWDGDDVPDPNLAPDFKDEDGISHPLAYQNYSYTPQPPTWGTCFGSSGEPRWQEVIQGGVGSCWLLAGLAATVRVNENAIRQAIIELPDGTFLVEWNGKHYRQDADLPSWWDGQQWGTVYVTLGDDSSHASHLGDRDYALWVAVFEKVVADARFGIGEILSFGEYDSVEIGTAAETFRKLGGDGRSLIESLIVAGIRHTPTAIANYIDESLARGEAVGCTTFDLIGPGFVHLYSTHAYMATAVIRDGHGQPIEIELYNPWGYDVNSDDLLNGSKVASGDPNDGILQVPLLEFFLAFRYSPLQIAISDFSRFEE